MQLKILRRPTGPIISRQHILVIERPVVVVYHHLTSRCESASACIYVECSGTVTGAWVKVSVKLMKDIGRREGDAREGVGVGLGGGGVDSSSGEEVTQGLVGLSEVHKSMQVV
jgi:hypothetical protein